MAKNTIQFQKGLSVPEFLSQYGIEEQCHKALFLWRWPKGFVCPECGYDRYCSLYSTKLPMSTWFLGIYFITQSKVSVSALGLKRMIGVSYNTALLMKHKVQQVMKERDDSTPITSSIIRVDDAYWGGKKRDGRRGRGATGKLPFVAAVSTNDQVHPIAMRLSQVETFSKEAIMGWASNHLCQGDKVVSDGLNCFNGFGDAGFSHRVIITGGGDKSVEIAELKWVNTIISNVKRSLHGTFHAISKKHFPGYLAEFCYRFNRRFDLCQMIPRFAYVVLRVPPFPQRLMKVAELCG